MKPFPPASPLRLACPRCRMALAADGPDAARCPAEGTVYYRVEGIWRMLLPERTAVFERFSREYERVRQAEGWGLPERTYYLALPFRDLSGRHRDVWAIRRRSYQTLVAEIVEPQAKAAGRPLRVLDLGAGNGWLSYRLSQQGQQVAAVDLLTNAVDGLGAHVYYGRPFLTIQAEFDRLPLSEGQVDLVIFNGSLHYASHYEQTLAEALRALTDEGQIVIMDSPFYHDPDSGRRMVQEREERFAQLYGFRGDSLPNENYLTFDRLAELGRQLHLAWAIHRPFYGWRWALRPWIARLRGSREPATFVLAVGRCFDGQDGQD
ncbi:MAG: class I SAM-dependent methyltransferase [Chloroflexota bacterium]